MQSNSLHFGTKAQTLEHLAGCSDSFRVPPLLAFTVARWANEPEAVLAAIGDRFGKALLAVRSSAHAEDGAAASQAGAFASRLGVSADDVPALRAAIAAVLDSYQRQPAGAREDDEILVQAQVIDIDAAGVILTRCIDDGSPYYVFSYDDESGKSDAVTAGRGVHKTVLLYRQARAEHCDSERLRQMLALARELEGLFGTQPLDIEFALDRQGQMHLLQVRRIASVRDWHPDTESRVARALPPVERFIAEANAPQPGLYGARTLFGIMPDWNPAELIGAVPSPLAASLFRWLVSAGVWHQARKTMGYRALPPTELMVLINGHAFIDVRASFNSFLPAELPSVVGECLVECWLDQLAAQPALHDKIEFAVVPTALDFTFAERVRAREAQALSAVELLDWQQRLRTLTADALRLDAGGSLAQAEAAVAALAQVPVDGMQASAGPSALAARISALLTDCRDGGTRPFSILARHAFIAEALLRSAVARGALSAERLAAFKASVRTVMGELTAAMQAVSAGRLSEAAFLDRFGHLRPGTFDLLSPCYRDRPELFTASAALTPEPELESPPVKPFVLMTAEQHALNALLVEAGLETATTPEALFEHARRAIQGREYGKFVFTRHLSAALESVAAWGQCRSLGREELSYLRIDEILDTRQRSARLEMTSHLMLLVDQARLDQAQARALRLSYLVRGVGDLYVVPIHRAEPSFITRARVEAPRVRLHATSLGGEALAGCIVCIEQADPGFDWIFTRGIAGLITQYGGANSHMAIRCAELQLPAAIGCGEALFTQATAASRVLLDCASQRVEGVG